MSCNCNMYNNYDDEIFDYYTTSSFDNRIKDYLLDRYMPRVEWLYDDTLSITFDIKECDCDDAILEDLEGKYIRVEFFNFRYEYIPLDIEIEADESFTVNIDYEYSKKYFTRGIYFCNIRLLLYNEDKTSIISADTILPRESCFFYVK